MAASPIVKIDQSQFLDPRWRLSNLYTVIDQHGDRIPFRPNGVQLKFLDELHDLNIILKARQLGITTLCCLIYLDACIFKPNTRAGVTAHKVDDAKTIFRDKIKLPYDALDEGIKNACPATQDSADSLSFGNNSSIRVSTSMRSGTLQYFHVSEFGKICAQYPEKAREIVTGSLNAVHAGQFVVIESTAEGQDGAFYRMCQDARAQAEARKKLSPLDYKFHFYPWWQEPSYSLPGDLLTVVISEEHKRYFEKLEADGIKLTRGQQAWYVAKERINEGDMRREFPATPDEAFEQALEGAYFSTQLAVANKHGRIGGFPLDPRYLVNTFWDLGRNDANTIWLHQYIKGYHRFVSYYENSGEFIGFYIKWLRDWAEEHGITFGDHYLPHDGDRESLWLEGGTKTVMEKMKFRPKFVSRPVLKMEAIDAARGIFPRCQFDEAGCAEGLKRLRAYRKEWDEDHSVWRDRPRHDDASHGCLIAGEMVETSRGKIPIELVVVGDQVQTPAGWSAVTHAGPVKKATELIEIWSNTGIRVLTCTPEHKILTRRGFVTASSLTMTDELLTGREWMSHLLGFASKVTPISFRAIITGEMSGALKDRPISTAPSMCTHTAIFQRALRFIIASIENAVGSTMTRPILKPSTQPSISVNTCWNDMLTAPCGRPAMLRARLPQNGINRQRASLGTVNMASALGKPASGTKNLVRNAVSYIARLILRAPSTATSIALIKRCAVETANQWVFDLTIEKNACYRANGVLVSNSDAFQTFACSGFVEGERLAITKDRQRYGDKDKPRATSAWAV